MRSGLHSYSELRSFNEVLDSDPSRAWHPDELVALGLTEKVDFPPGSDWHYSNTNTVLAGMIIERYDRRPLEESFQARIFAKLSLRNTLLPAQTSAAIPEPHPRGYMYGTNVSTLTTSRCPRANSSVPAAANSNPATTPTPTPPGGGPLVPAYPQRPI